MAHPQRISQRWLILLGAILLVFVVAVVWVMVTRSQNSNGSLQILASEQDEPASDAAGWYTEDQANRGEEAYAQSCAQCHGEGLEGSIGPALTGDAFWDRCKGETVRTFFEVTSRTMPQDDPGSLELETYTDITAYVLRTNGFPVGQEALPPEDDRLDELVIDRSATTDAGEGASEADAGAEGQATEAESENEDDVRTEGEAAEPDREAEDAAAPPRTPTSPPAVASSRSRCTARAATVPTCRATSRRRWPATCSSSAGTGIPSIGCTSRRAPPCPPTAPGS